MTINEKAFGENLRAILDEKDMSIQKAHILTGVNPTTIGGWINYGHIPRLHHVMMISAGLEVPLESLTKGMVQDD